MKSRRAVRAGASATGSARGAAIANTALGTAVGTLQLGARPIPLAFAFALLEQDVLAGTDREKLTVLLTDHPVPEDLRRASNEWLRWAERQARADALHGVILHIDPETCRWERGQLLTRQGFMLYSEETSSPELARLRFELAGRLGAEVAAKVSMAESLPSLEADDARWTAEAMFRCTVIPRPAVEAELTGKAALASPHYLAVQAFLAACRKRDPAAILAAVEPSSRESMAAMFAANKAEALQMFAGMAAETAKLTLGKVTVRGASAEVAFRGAAAAAGAEQTLRVALVSGDWKLAQ